MNFQLNQTIQILERTPAVLAAWLEGLSDEWIYQNEGDDTWSPFDVVGHLIHGEKTDWVPRMKIILEHGDAQPFEPFDRFAQFEASKGKSLSQLLGEFARLRFLNLETLKNTPLSPADLNRKGMHPALGEVTLRQLLATWAVHDLTHIHQIARVLAKQYGEEVGAWKAYLGVLR